MNFHKPLKVPQKPVHTGGGPILTSLDASSQPRHHSLKKFRTQLKTKPLPGTATVIQFPQLLLCSRHETLRTLIDKSHLLKTIGSDENCFDRLDKHENKEAFLPNEAKFQQD